MLTKFSLQTRNLLRACSNFKAIHKQSLTVSKSNRSNGLRLYSSKSSSASDVEDVDNQELKRRIDSFYEGDGEALPSIFEAILSRKLSGNHEESDDELVKQLQEKSPMKDDDEDGDFDSDSDFDGSDDEDDDGNRPAEIRDNRTSLLANVMPHTFNHLRLPPIANPSCGFSPIPVSCSSRSHFRLFSSESHSSQSLTESAQEQTQHKDLSVDVEDVPNKELKQRIQKYFKGDEEALPSILEAILQRKLGGKHDETDDELMDELERKPVDDVNDKEIESDFEELYETDEEIDNLYNAKEHVIRKMTKGGNFNMDDKKWDDMIRESTEKGYLKDTKECEEILEDMLRWEDLLPDDLKKKVEARFEELGDMCERKELTPEEAYELFKEFEDEMVEEYGKRPETEKPPEFDEAEVPDTKKDLDDPPGEGPILRWQTRVVFSPGGDAWHPKNRKVKLSVTVKELGLSKHQFRRLRELVGKRYHSGKDELTITSERFEHREENRKDCLRTLFSLIEEAGKANKMAEEARAAYVKERLKANPEFMKRLHDKTMRMRESTLLSA